jgi:dephospho-CoA kinase
MYRVGLTGNVASGKSAVSAVWRELGACVVDADVLAREAVAPGTAAHARIVGRFGTQVLEAGGGLDRAALRERVFADDAARRDLEAIVHPEVGRLRDAEEQAHASAGGRIIVHEIPLLFEVGLAGDFDAIVLVDASEAERLRRLTSSRGLGEDVARRIIAAQMPAAAKRAAATYIIDNDGTLDQLRARAADVWHRIEGDAARCA